MTQDDDAEGRIADLERSTAESAAGSEAPPLGEKARVGLRAGWVVLGLMVVALVLGGGAILSHRSSQPIAGTPIPGEMPDETAEAPAPPVMPVPPVMPIPTAEPAPSATAPTAVEIPGDSISVAGVGKTETIACDDRVATVSGVDNTVTLTGHCGRVDVSGVGNTVTVDSADAIVVSGLNNRVTFLSGTPQLDQSGMNNTLERG